MKVVFLDNVRGIGRVGDVKEVNDGYARNFLLPRGLAKTANAGTIKDVEGLKAHKLAAQSLAQEQLSTLRAKLETVTLTLKGTANEKGTLFKAVTERDVARELSVLLGIRIEASAVHMDAHLKHVGSHVIRVQLGTEPPADVRVTVESATS